MPRNYKRKTSRQSWCEVDMLKALDACKNGVPYKTAAKMFNINVMALKRRAKGQNKYATGAHKILGSKRRVFNQAQERELVKHIKDMEVRMYGLTKKSVCNLAYELAEKNKIQHNFSNKKKCAGEEWLRSFRARNTDIALRDGESTSSARARAFNKPVVEKFFNVYKQIIEKHPFPPHRVFNVDETSISTVPTKNTKIFAQKGRKQVSRIVSAERGETTTAVICVAAGGNFIPPMFIFRRVRMKMELMDGAPPGSAFACNTSGWMNLEVFEQWFDNFLLHAKPTEEDPALLILDGHLSHTKNLNVILKARENNTTILCLPPHTTHKLQPLDVGIMYPLSIYHNQALEKWMNNNPGRVVTTFQITKIFGEGYLKAAVPLNAVNAFAKCGIFPFNPDVFTDVDFIAAEATEMELNASTFSHLPEQSVLSPSTSNQSLNPSAQLPNTSDDQFPSTSAQLQKPSAQLPSTSAQLPSTSAQSPTPSALSRANSPSIIESEMQTASVETDPDPSTSFVLATPSQLKPFPKMEGLRSKVKRSSNHVAVLTSTPYKNHLEEEKQRKDNLEMKKAQRNNLAKKKEKPKTNKKKGKCVTKKPKKRQTQSYESDTSDETCKDDTECLYCTEPFSKDNRGEGWIMCCVCQRWGHDSCAGVDKDDAGEFTCDLCSIDDKFARVKHRLNL